MQFLLGRVESETGKVLKDVCVVCRGDILLSRDAEKYHVYLNRFVLSRKKMTKKIPHLHSKVASGFSFGE